MKKFKTLSLLTALFVSVIIISCEGPAGPAGPAGNDALSKCNVCHNVTTDLKSKILQYELSTHATGTAYDRGTSATCAPCHSSEGFKLKIAGEEVVGIENPTPVNCRTCHTIHTNYDMTDFEPATVAPVTLVGDLTNGTVVDIGKGNLCANCHQPRSRNYGLEVNGADVEINSSYWGPHYGTQSSILVGTGGFEVPGSVAYNNTPHATLVQDGCVTCHMVNENHTFEPSTDACETCHSDIGDYDDFDYRDVQTEMTGLLEELKVLLLAEGLLSEDEDGEVHPVSDVTTTANKAGALFNYRTCYSEGSHGIHNPKYVKALLTNSIEVFD